MERLEIPLKLLELAPENPRENPDPEALESLGQSIEAQGLLQGLVAYRANGVYRVTAGGRRLRALRLLLERGKLTEDYPVPVLVLPREEAIAAGLAENTLRQPMTLEEELRATITLVKTLGPEETALRLGLNPKTVAERAKLAHLSPKAWEALVNKKLSVRQALLLAELPPDTQDHILETHGVWWTPETLRRVLGEPENLLFTPEEYTERGGALLQDLEGKPTYTNPRLVLELQTEKAAAIAENTGIPLVNEEKLPRGSFPYGTVTPGVNPEDLLVRAREAGLVPVAWYLRPALTLAVRHAREDRESPKPAARLRLARRLTRAWQLGHALNPRQAMALAAYAMLWERRVVLERPHEPALTGEENRELQNAYLKEVLGLLNLTPTSLHTASPETLERHPNLERAFALLVTFAHAYEEAEAPIRRFLTPKTLSTQPLPNLQKALGELGLPQTGKKRDLVDRLLELDPDTPVPIP